MLAKPTLAKKLTDFGQPQLADFGQADFGQNWCFSLLAFFKKHRRTNTLRGPEGGAPGGWGPGGWGDPPPLDHPPPDRPLPDPPPLDHLPPLDPPLPDRPKFRAYFSLSRHNVLSFFPLLGVLSWNEFWWCLKRRGPKLCTFGVLGLLCEAPAALGPLGFHQGPGLQTHHQNSTRRPPNRGKKERKLLRERKKKERNFGRSGGRGSGEGAKGGAPGLGFRSSGCRSSGL